MNYKRKMSKSIDFHPQDLNRSGKIIAGFSKIESNNRLSEK